MHIMHAAHVTAQVRHVMHPRVPYVQGAPPPRGKPWVMRPRIMIERQIQIFAPREEERGSG